MAKWPTSEGADAAGVTDGVDAGRDIAGGAGENDGDAAGREKPGSREIVVGGLSLGAEGVGAEPPA